MTPDPTGAGPSPHGGGPAAGDGENGEETPRVVIRDKRRIDPETGDLRPREQEAGVADDSSAYQGRHARPGEDAEGGEPGTIPGVPSGWPTGEEARRPTSPATSSASAAAARAAYADAARGTGSAFGQADHPVDRSGRADDEAVDETVEVSGEWPGEQVGAAETGDAPEPAAAEPGAGSPEPEGDLAAERLADLHRLQAEYVNYKRRVDRDRDVERERAVAGVVEALLPVLDEIHLARQHGELVEGPFAKIAEKLEGILGRYGVARYGEPGEAFDPVVHEAVMHMEAELAPGTTATTVVQVMQPGYRMGEKVVRPALVAVADPA